MTIHAAYKTLLAGLYDLYDDREAENIANWVIENVTGLPKIERILNRDMLLSEPQQQRLQSIADELKKNRPVQYVLNEAWFANMKLYVDENVLIPRPETEELVDWIVRDVRAIHPRRENNLCLLDVGTGSGCIAIALKKQLPANYITAVDVSDDALAVAGKNASLQQVLIEFMQLDFLRRMDRETLPKFDVIVSNPPYIKQTEAADMAPRVKDFEPNLALFVPDNDPLVFYTAIAEFGQQHLSQKGSIYMEVNEALAQNVAELFTRQGYTDVQVRTDMQEKERMVKANK